MVTFGTIRDYIRAAVQDTHSVQQMYSDNALNSQIRLSVLQHGWTEHATEPEIITNAISIQDQLTLILEIAIRLISGRPDDFSYRSPVLTVSRRGQTQKLLENLEQALEDILSGGNGNRIACATETDITAFLQALDRYFNEYQAASNVYL